MLFVKASWIFDELPVESQSDRAPETITKVKEAAEKLYADQCKEFLKKRDMSAADQEWFNKILVEGTVSDRLSALSIQIKESPFYSLEWMAKVLMMAGSTSRHESTPATESLCEAFAILLPKRPLLNMTEYYTKYVKGGLGSRDVLLKMYFEDVLKRIFGDFCKMLDIMIHDQIQNSRETAMRLLFHLLMANKDECKNQLLQTLVNKLGDPVRKIASRAAFYLQCLVNEHEDYTMPVVQLVRDQVIKPNSANDKPAYYGLTFFSELKLYTETPEVTEILLSAYQHHLELFLNQFNETQRRDRRKADIDEEMPRVIKVVLTGLGRAIPFAAAEQGADLVEYGTKLVAVTGRMRSYGMLLQAATLVFRIFNQDDLSDHAAILDVLVTMVCDHLLDYSRLADATASHAMLFKLLYKIFVSLGESKVAVQALAKMLKALLSVSILVVAPAFATASLLLLNEALDMKPVLRKELALYELQILSQHWNPIVSQYALLLMTGKKIDISTVEQDPFVALTNMSLLDQVVRNS